MVEIDEAAAVEWFLLARRGYITAGNGNAARAALAWKARAESEKAEHEALGLFVRGLSREDQAAIDAMKALRARAEAAEAEVKRLVGQLRSERGGRWNSASDDPEGRRS